MRRVARGMLRCACVRACVRSARRSRRQQREHCAAAPPAAAGPQLGASLDPRRLLPALVRFGEPGTPPERREQVLRYVRYALEALGCHDRCARALCCATSLLCCGSRLETAPMCTLSSPLSASAPFVLSSHTSMRDAPTAVSSLSACLARRPPPTLPPVAAAATALSPTWRWRCCRWKTRRCGCSASWRPRGTRWAGRSLTSSMRCASPRSAAGERLAVELSAVEAGKQLMCAAACVCMCVGVWGVSVRRRHAGQPHLRLPARVE